MTTNVERVTWGPRFEPLPAMRMAAGLVGRLARGMVRIAAPAVGASKARLVAPGGGGAGGAGGAVQRDLRVLRRSVILVCFFLGLAAIAEWGGRSGVATADPFGLGNAASVPFVPHALAMTRTATELLSQPSGGEAIGVLPPGTRLVVGGVARVRVGLRTRSTLWSRVEDATGARFGFVAADAAMVAVGDPPVVDLRGIPVEQLLGPVDGGRGAGDGSGGVAAARAAGTGAEVTIPWLPETVSRWSELIVRSASQHGVDPNLVAIIVLVESGGNPTAVSSSGAMGLMQVMPMTAADIAGRRGIADHDAERLYDPGYNIDFGTWYLADMLRTFGSADDPDWQTSVELAAAAYNGGPGTVQRFLRSGGGLPAESSRYRRWVGQMWSERLSASSLGFDSWMAAGGGRLVEAASAAGVL